MKILAIDLEKERFSYMEDNNLRTRYLGGVALNTHLLYNYTKRINNPFDKKNHLFTACGALAGITIPAVSRCEATALSPTGYFGTSNSGGGIGAALKFCGIDGIWIKGKSSKPLYLVIDEDGVLFKDAHDVWGKDTFDTVDVLKMREGKTTEVASIGPTREKGVRFASIQNGYYHSFGRTSLEAIMGNKPVKAICLRGNAEIAVQNKTRFTKVVKKLRGRIMSSDSFGYTRQYGSMVVSDVYNRLGMDVISTSAIVAFKIELCEKGMFKKSEIGLEPKFADFQSISRLISMIGKREGIREVFDEGIQGAKKHFKCSEPFACDIKDLEMPVRDFERNYDDEPLSLSPAELELVDMPQSVKENVLNTQLQKAIYRPWQSFQGSWWCS